MNRRDFLKALGVGGVTLALPVNHIATTLAQAPPGTLSPTVAPRDAVHRVITRLTFGVTPALYEHVQRIGISAFIEEQLNPSALADEDAERISDRYRLIDQTAAQLIEAEVLPQRILNDVLGATFVRARYSTRGLHERMVHFWSDHFNIYIRNAITLYLKGDHDRDVIRQHALGNFRDLLMGTAKSPAMLFYLDNVQSTGRAPNENFARELLELHTLGVDGGYTEDDVAEVARAFTGWSSGTPRDPRGEVGVFVFRAFMHDSGEKTILGRRFPARRGQRGILDGEEVIEMLATHPSTAQFVSRKLVRHFVADDPPPGLVEQTAQTFLRTDGDIKAVLRTIFNSDAFMTAGPKFRRPFEYTMALQRAVGYTARNEQLFSRTLFQKLEAMGHLPFHWPAPNGYPDVASYWVQNLLPRWNAAIDATANRRQGQPDLVSLRQLIEAQPNAEPFDTLAHYLIGRGLTHDEVRVLDTFMQRVDGTMPERVLAGIALILASPAFQVV